MRSWWGSWNAFRYIYTVYGQNYLRSRSRVSVLSCLRHLVIISKAWQSWLEPEKYTLSRTWSEPKTARRELKHTDTVASAEHWTERASPYQVENLVYTSPRELSDTSYAYIRFLTIDSMISLRLLILYSVVSCRNVVCILPSKAHQTFQEMSMSADSAFPESFTTLDGSESYLLDHLFGRPPSYTEPAIEQPIQNSPFAEHGMLQAAEVMTLQPTVEVQAGKMGEVVSDISGVQILDDDTRNGRNSHGSSCIALLCYSMCHLWARTHKISADQSLMVGYTFTTNLWSLMKCKVHILTEKTSDILVADKHQFSLNPYSYCAQLRKFQVSFRPAEYSKSGDCQPTTCSPGIALDQSCGFTITRTDREQSLWKQSTETW